MVRATPEEVNPVGGWVGSTWRVGRGDLAGRIGGGRPGRRRPAGKHRDRCGPARWGSRGRAGVIASAIRSLMVMAQPPCSDGLVGVGQGVGRLVTRRMPVRWPGGRRQGCVATVRAAIPGAGFQPGGPIAAPVDRCCSRRSLRRNTFEPSVPTGAAPWRRAHASPTPCERQLRRYPEVPSGLGADHGQAGG
jgi:hypothetical protein